MSCGCKACTCRRDVEVKLEKARDDVQDLWFICEELAGALQNAAAFVPAGTETRPLCERALEVYVLAQREGLGRRG